MADWRNVGNWHWKERNCFDWAKKYLEDKLTGTKVASGGFSAEVTSVDSVSGDVDLNIRKGRLIAIYDVEVKLSWTAQNGEDSLAGKITIPEVAHDTDDYVYDISANESTVAKLPLKDFVRKNLTTAIGEKLENFTEDLKQTNGSDMYIPDNKAGTAAAPASNEQLASDFKHGKVGSSAAADSEEGVVLGAKGAFSTVSITQNIEFVCSAGDLFATLTDPQRVSVWTRAKADIEPKAGCTFKLFGGHIEGEITKLEKDKLIEQKWRVATWPKGHYSSVKITLEQTSSSTRLALKQTGVPFNEEDATKANWDKYYWNSIKGSFGYGL